MSFSIAVSGLTSSNTDLNVISNNIANVGTTGYKFSRAEFGDLFASNFYNDATSITSTGARVLKINQQFNQGSIESTTNNLDLALDGDGFFIVSDDVQGQNRFYTRAGAFGVDNEYRVVNPGGEYLLGFDGKPIVIDPGSPAASSAREPKATSSVDFNINLDAKASPPLNDDGSYLDLNGGTYQFDPEKPTTYTYATAATVYDVLGVQHTANLYFIREPIVANQGTDSEKVMGTTTWRVYNYVDGKPATSSSSNPYETLVFTQSGNLISPDPAKGVTGSTAQGAVYTVDFSEGTGTVKPSQITFTFDNSTQHAGGFGVNDLTQDGYEPGYMTGVSVTDDGKVEASFSNGRTAQMGQLVLARFHNSQGLQPMGKTLWAETFESGPPLTNPPGEGGAAVVNGGALEKSNVNLPEQLVKLIEAQRNYQSNAQSVKAEDGITQTIINLR